MKKISSDVFFRIFAYKIGYQPADQQKEKIKAIKIDIAFKKQFEQLLADVAVIKSACMELKTDLGEIKDDLKSLKLENEVSKKEINLLKDENHLLKVRLNELEQYSKKNNIIINGIPWNQDEKLNEMVSGGGGTGGRPMRLSCRGNTPFTIKEKSSTHNCKTE